MIDEAEAEQHAADRHLGEARGSGSARRLPRPEPDETGVKTKIMNGLNAWNQVDGIRRCRTENDRAVGVGVGPELRCVLPCCSYTAQNERDG